MGPIYSEQELPPVALAVIAHLEAAGYLAYLVGGCLRDILRGTRPKDIDIATSATPESVHQVFSAYTVIDTGLRYGTVTLLYDAIPIEITTFRSEGAYVNARRPEWVTFHDDIHADLERRDFTINAMAYAPREGLIDDFGGLADLRLGCIRAVGDAKARFSEDALRMLRAVRFAAVLGFHIEVHTKNAITELAEALDTISVERIQAEFSKLLLGDALQGLTLLRETGLLDRILPELVPSYDFDQKNPYHTMDVFSHALCVTSRVPPRLPLRLAALLHDVAKPACFTFGADDMGHFYGHDIIGADMAHVALTRLKYPKHLVSHVCDLVRYHMVDATRIGARGIKKRLALFGGDLDDLIALHEADVSCTTLALPPNLFRDAVADILKKKSPSLERLSILMETISVL